MKGVWYIKVLLYKEFTIFLSVASDSNPPKVIMGVRQAKYKNTNDAIHWTLRASFKSLG